MIRSRATRRPLLQSVAHGLVGCRVGAMVCYISNTPDACMQPWHQHLPIYQQLADQLAARGYTRVFVVAA